MKRTMILTMALVIMMLPLTVRSQHLVKEYHDDYSGPLEVQVWVDNEDGIYYKGDDIGINFQASRDCFVAIYSVDTRGYVNLLFPETPYDEGFVKGGEVYTIPGRNANYDLVVSGPEGIEHIEAVASVEQLDIPDWYDGSPLKANSGDDRDDFIGYINDRYFACRYSNCERVFDHTAIYVKVPSYYYKPVYVPQYWYDYPYYSVVYFDYPYGAEVYIDGIYFGIAPLWIPRVYVGWHWVTIYDRYGYCWEHHYDFVNNTTIYFDRTIVKPSRMTTSRYKDVRKQATKYSRSDYLLSDKSVRPTRIKSDRSDPLTKGGDLNMGRNKSGGGAPDKGFDGSRPSTRTSDQGSGKRYDTRTTKRYETDSKNTERYSGNSSRKSTGSRDWSRSGSSRKSTGSSDSYNTDRKSGGATKSTGTAGKSGNTKKSAPSSGAVRKNEPSSQPSTPKSKSGGSVKRSSSSSHRSSSSGQAGSGRTASPKSSSGKSSNGNSSGRSKKP